METNDFRVGDSVYVGHWVGVVYQVTAQWVWVKFEGSHLGEPCDPTELNR